MRPSWQQRAPQTDLEDDGCFFFFFLFFFCSGFLSSTAKRGGKVVWGSCRLEKPGLSFVLTFGSFFPTHAAPATIVGSKKKKLFWARKAPTPTWVSLILFLLHNTSKMEWFCTKKKIQQQTGSN